MPSEWAIARAKQHLSRVWYGAFKETSRDNLPALLDDVRREERSALADEIEKEFPEVPYVAEWIRNGSS